MLHAALDATGIICVGQFPAHRPGSHERCCTAAARWICGTEAASGRGGGPRRGHAITAEQFLHKCSPMLQPGSSARSWPH
jgi:hypothetical protein